MSSYSEGYRDGSNASSGWGDFFGFVGTILFIMLMSGLIRVWGELEERQRIDKLLAPYGVTVEHLEKQAEIAKAAKLAQPISSTFMKGDAK